MHEAESATRYGIEAGTDCTGIMGAAYADLRSLLQTSASVLTASQVKPGRGDDEELVGRINYNKARETMRGAGSNSLIISRGRIHQFFRLVFGISCRKFLDYCVQREINNCMPDVPVMQRMNHRAHHHIDESGKETNMQQLLMP